MASGGVGPAPTRVFTPASSCFTSPLSLAKTDTPTTRGGTVTSYVTVGCPQNSYLSYYASQKASLATDCCGPFGVLTPDGTSAFYPQYSPLMARGQICPEGYLPRSLGTVGAETTAICCPSGYTDGYGGSTLCSSTYDGTTLATGSEYVTVTNVSYQITPQTQTHNHIRLWHSR